MTIYYHVSTTQHPVGFVIQPGRFGGLFTNAPATVQDGFVMTWEATLETARRVISPNAVSRLHCVFGCQDIAGAQTFQKYRPNSFVHEVEVPDDTPIHLGNFDLISYSQSGSYIERWASNSISYWQDKPKGMIEVLIGGAATVVK